MKHNKCISIFPITNSKPSRMEMDHVHRFPINNHMLNLIQLSNSFQKSYSQFLAIQLVSSMSKACSLYSLLVLNSGTIWHEGISMKGRRTETHSQQCDGEWSYKINDESLFRLLYGHALLMFYRFGDFIGDEHHMLTPLLFCMLKGSSAILHGHSGSHY